MTTQIFTALLIGAVLLNTAVRLTLTKRQARYLTGPSTPGLVCHLLDGVILLLLIAGFNSLPGNDLLLFGFVLVLLSATKPQEIIPNVLIGVPMGLAVVWLMSHVQTAWWAWCWAIWAVCSVFGVLIVPMFCGHERLVSGLYVTDKGCNAFITGFGHLRRIIVSKRLLSILSADELQALIAHELGHSAHRHVIKRLTANLALSFTLFLFMGWLQGRSWSYLNATPTHARAIVLFVLVMPALLFWLTPLNSWISRRFERQADAYAATRVDPKHLISALLKLDSGKTSDPWYAAFHDGYPPLKERVILLRRIH